MTQQFLRNIVAKQHQQRYKQRYDNKHQFRQYHLGDFVLYNSVKKPEFRGANKFAPKLHGPYVIHEIKGVRTYVIRHYRDSRLQELITVDVDKLFPYHFRDPAEYESVKEDLMHKRSEVLLQELQRRDARGRASNEAGVMSQNGHP